jgi:hypothetical protein
MALEFLRVAMAAHGMTVPLEVISACARSSAGVGGCSCIKYHVARAAVPFGKLRMWMDAVSRFS